MNERTNLYIRAIQKWGASAQYIMVIEECAEFIHQITRILRGSADSGKVAEELADIEIMIEQFRILQPDVAVQADIIKHEKLDRLRERLDES